MRTLDLDQYWPAANGAGKSAEHENGAGAAGARSHGAEASSREVSDHVHAQASTTVRDRRTPIIWGGLGFVAGMFAWHVI